MVKLDADYAVCLGLGLSRLGAGVGVAHHGLHVLEALLVAVVVAAEMGFIVVHAGVALGTEAAVEGLLGLFGRGGLRWREGLVSLERETR